MTKQQIVLSDDNRRRFSRIVDAEPPEYLSPVAAQLWRELLPDLGATGALTTLDVAALCQLCEAYSDWVAAKAELKGEMFYEDNKGIRRVSPAYQLLSDADRRLRGWLQEFHLTPSARIRWQERYEPAPAEQTQEQEQGDIDLSHLSPLDRAEFARMLRERQAADVIE